MLHKLGHEVNDAKNQDKVEYYRLFHLSRNFLRRDWLQ